MIKICIAFLLVTGFAAFVQAEDKVIHYTELGTSGVIGSLGVPLGTVVIVEGVVVDDGYRQSKEDEGAILLKIEKVDSKKLDKEVILRMATFSFAPIKQPEPGYRFTYAGYETGEFSGIPHEAFMYIPQVATTEFHFRVYFQALKEVK